VSESDSNDQAVAAKTVQDAVVLSVQGEHVALQDALVGLAAGSELCCQDSLIVVANAGTLSGDARVLVEGKSLVLAVAAGGVLFALAQVLLGRRKG
jgi:hypothetical protein